MTRGEEDSASPGARISCDAGVPVSGLQVGRLRLGVVAVSRHKALTTQLGREASRIFGSSRQSPRALQRRCWRPRFLPGEP